VGVRREPRGVSRGSRFHRLNSGSVDTDMLSSKRGSLMSPAKCSLLITMAVGLLAGLAVCQEHQRIVGGSVTYRGGEIAPEATVQIEDVASKQVISCIAGRDGHYRFEALKLDKEYILRATKNGHWSEIHHVSKFAGKTTEVVNLRLKADPD
jgi:Carboxypeptidase regulatory-like domain